MRRPLRLALLAGIAALTAAAGCGGPTVNDAHTDAEVLDVFEDRIAEAVAVLPDFPGFEQRERWLHPCRYGDEGEREDADHLVAVTDYWVREDDFGDPMLRGDYPELLAEAWAESGYDVATEHGADGAVEQVSAESADGVTVVYQIWGTIAFRAYHSGCVPVDADAPLGGAEPLEEGLVGDRDRFTDEYGREH